MSIYPEGSLPQGSNSLNQLILKYAEEQIETQFVDPHGYSIYPTGDSTPNAIKTGDSLQIILAKLLGAAQGGYVTADTSVIEADIAALEAAVPLKKDGTIRLFSTEGPTPYFMTVDEVDLFVTTGSEEWTITLPALSVGTPDGEELDYLGPYRVSVSIGSTAGTTVNSVAVSPGEVIEYMVGGGGVWTYKITPSGSGDILMAISGAVAGDLEFSGQTNLSGLSEYADDAAAGVGGLVAGDLYTTTGTIKIKL